MTAISVQEHVPLRDLTTLKIGGTARFFCSVYTEQNLKTAFLFAKEKELPVVILGGGSNVLISDAELNAVVMKNEIKGIQWDEETKDAVFLSSTRKRGSSLDSRFHGNDSHDTDVRSVLVIAGAGENWDALSAEAVRRGLWGIENLSGIPGTVGAAPIQNIGAYGAELADVLEWVEAFDAKTGEMRRFSNAECGFQYRDSVFKQKEGKSLIVTRVALRLSRNVRQNLVYKDMKAHFAGRSNPSLSEIRQAVLEIRSKKFPDLAECGTAGSFFKNPIVSKGEFNALRKKYPELPGFELRIKDKGLRIKIPLAWILDNICGLRGYHKGNVALFERQPIVLVQTGFASAEEVEAFAGEISEIVKEKTGIDVEWEVQKI